MKKQQQATKTAGKKTTAKTASYVSGKYVAPHFPNWIYIVIVGFTFILYGNSLFNEFALDDTMVLTQNEFVKEGVSGIPKIFKYDTFIGRYGEQVTNLPGGRYRPLSVAMLAVEYDLFVNADVKQIIHDKLDPSKTQLTVPKKYLTPEMIPHAVDTTQAIVMVNKTAPKQNDDDAPLYMKTMLPFVCHFVNMLLFAITACFLFKLMWRLFPVNDAKGWKLFLNVPVITTLLFVAHPVHVEAIANIKGRDEIMTFLGALMALFYTLRWLDTRKAKFLAITFICFLAGAFSKENAITFLAIIPITIYFFAPCKLKDYLVACLPSVAAALIFLAVRGIVITWSPLPETELMNAPFLGMRPYEKWSTIIYVLGRYLWLLIFPHPLTTDYYPYYIPKMTPADIGTWVSLLLYLGMFIVMLWSMAPKRKNRYGYAIVWFLIPLSVVSNVFVEIGTLMNERFVYISSVGFCLAVAYCLINNVPNWIKNVKIYRCAVTCFMVVVLGLYSAKTIARNPEWNDDFTLSTTDVKVSYNSAKSNYDAARVYNIKTQTETDSTKRDFYIRQIYKYSKRAIAIHPYYENASLLFAWSNTVLSNQPDSAAKYPPEPALKALMNLVKRNPQNPTVLDGVSMVLSRVPDPAQRAAVWEQIVALAPDRFEANYNLAHVYAYELGRGQEAIPYLEKTIALNPQYVNGIMDLGSIYRLTGNQVKAVELFEKAAALAPNDVRIWGNLWQTYLALGDTPKAERAHQRYVSLGGQ